MKRLKTYLPTLIAAILLVFVLLGVSGIVVVRNFADSARLIQIAEDNGITEKILTSLEKNYKLKYNETGIPSEVYMEALSEQYINSAVEKYITDGFAVLEGDSAASTFTAPVNEELESSIEAFFSDYAEQNDYEKDENYEKKLESTITSAYSMIGDSCDVYKLNMMNKEGILKKASPVYGMIGAITAILLTAAAVLLLVILLINIKQIKQWLYWAGTALLTAGIIGVVPGIYFSSSDFFDGFVIKQAQIFTAFTKLMYSAADSFLTNQVILIVAGAVLITIFAVIPKKSEEK